MKAHSPHKVTFESATKAKNTQRSKCVLRCIGARVFCWSRWWHCSLTQTHSHGGSSSLCPQLLPDTDVIGYRYSQCVCSAFIQLIIPGSVIARALLQQGLLVYLGLSGLCHLASTILLQRRQLLLSEPDQNRGIIVLRSYWNTLE